MEHRTIVHLDAAPEAVFEVVSSLVHTQEWPNAEADFELTRLFSFRCVGWYTPLANVAEYVTELVSTP